MKKLEAVPDWIVPNVRRGKIGRRLGHYSNDLIREEDHDKTRDERHHVATVRKIHKATKREEHEEVTFSKIMWKIKIQNDTRQRIIGYG